MLLLLVSAAAEAGEGLHRALGKGLNIEGQVWHCLIFFLRLDSFSCWGFSLCGRKTSDGRTGPPKQRDKMG